MKIKFPFNFKMFIRYTPWQAFWGLIWNIEVIPLGRFAPWVFGQMIGCKGRMINQEKENK